MRCTGLLVQRAKALHRATRGVIGPTGACTCLMLSYADFVRLLYACWSHNRHCRQWVFYNNKSLKFFIMLPRSNMTRIFRKNMAAFCCLCFRATTRLSLFFQWQASGDSRPGVAGREQVGHSTCAGAADATEHQPGGDALLVPQRIHRRAWRRDHRFDARRTNRHVAQTAPGLFFVFRWM
jgi:hypothetical protein